MPAPFPHHYEVDLAWESERRGTLMAPPRPPLAGAPPPEFDGQSDRWSPEHLLLASANLCLMTTFFTLAAKRGLQARAYRSRARGTLEKTGEGIVFTGLTLQVTVQVAPADVERAQQLLQSAKKYCIVTNSLKVPATLEASVQAV
ncbi:MAG: OsmC family protein [Acidobacteriota bacterium]